eukprot:CAMPEP_0194503522 /NCGR_PEP_ID=MMETSP0253-20130528/28428_1 /TAXON_ID=2966 /ORGANISM="Noctiluca scintillans" /LENGTH=189 /DNA_ID=CAMNT_0039345813 /DNA_START=748 /DNA_END=1318 /DNA_ORIENTATION=-
MAIFRFELPITCRLACSFAIDAFAATLSAEAQTPARAKAILAGSSEHGRLDAKESRMIWKFCECRSEAQEGDSPGATRITQIKDLFYPRLDFIIDASFGFSLWLATTVAALSSTIPDEAVEEASVTGATCVASSPSPSCGLLEKEPLGDNSSVTSRSSLVVCVWPPSALDAAGMSKLCHVCKLVPISLD